MYTSDLKTLLNLQYVVHSESQSTIVFLNKEHWLYPLTHGEIHNAAYVPTFFPVPSVPHVGMHGQMERP